MQVIRIDRVDRKEKMQIDRQLLIQIKKNDEKAIFQLYRHCYDHLYAVCRRYVSNEDEIGTLLNTAFMKIISNISSYKPSAPFEAWIKRITINTSIDYYRKNQKYKEMIQFPDKPNGVYGKEAVNYNEAEHFFDADDLLQLVRRLPPTTAKVFNLYVIDGYSHKEVAKMMNIAEGTSKWHLASARQKLQEMLAKQMENSKVR